MYNPRYNRTLASTALALILAVPLVSVGKNDNPPAAAPMSVTPAATPAEQASTQAAGRDRNRGETAGDLQRRFPRTGDFDGAGRCNGAGCRARSAGIARSR